MKIAILFFVTLLFASAQVKPDPKADTTKAKPDYVLKSDTTHIIIPDGLYTELTQIEQAIPILEKRKKDILNDILVFNSKKATGRYFRSMEGHTMIFERMDTIRSKPVIINKK